MRESDDSSDMTDVGTSRKTALAVVLVPKNELAIVAKQAGAKADKLINLSNRICIGGISASVAGVIGMVTVGVIAAPLAPVAGLGLGITAIGCLLGGLATSMVIGDKARAARRRQSEALLSRIKSLAATAKSALERAIADDTIRTGLDLRIVPENETPKQIHIKDISALVTETGEIKLKISARILEEDGTSVDWMRIWTQDSGVSFEQTVAKFPKAMLDSVRAATPPAVAASAPEPEPLAVQESEKRLPIGVPFSLGG